MRIIFSILTAFLLFSAPLFGQSVRKYSNEFLKIGVGARAAAMGNSQTSAVDDVTAGYWNPAALISLKHPEVAAMHSEYFAGIAKYDYIGFAMPIDENRAFGVSLIRLGVDDIANTLNLVDPNGNINFDAVERFSVADFAAIISYAQALPVEGLSVGANVKVVYRGIGKFGNAWGFGLDAGLMYKWKSLRAALMVSDISNTFNAWTFNTTTFGDVFAATDNVIPENSLEITLPATKLGLSYTFLEKKKFNILAALDLDFHYDGKRNVLVNMGRVSLDPHFGLELSYNKFVFLRGGFKNLQKVPNDEGKEVYSLYPTLGAGFSFKGISVDYALSNVGNFTQVLYSHVFSLKYNFGSIPKFRKKLKSSG